MNTIHRSRRTVGAALTAIAVALVATACGGDKSGGSAEQASPSNASPPASAAAPAPAATSTVVSLGETEFQRCAVCHQLTGVGVPNVFPPFAGSEIINGPVDKPIAIVLHGLQGPVTVKGMLFTNAMMAYGTGVEMSDAQIAAVLTYVRSHFGNTSGPVAESDVARVRAATAKRTTQWTIAELDAMK
jgi:mono/diheme cytochrome c family protein